MISVCIATYNGGKYIKEQLASILKQLGPTDEIIVSDDESSDNTLEIIQGFADKRIKVLHHKKNQEFFSKHSASFLLSSDNFENAINHSTGEYIYLADQDDVWADNRIELTLPLLKSNGIVMCNYSAIDADGKIIKEIFKEKDPVSKYFFKNLYTTPFLGCCMAFQRKALALTLPFPKPCIGHDFWIGCLLIHLGVRYSFIDMPLHRYRVHGSNVSPATGHSKNSLLFKISYRIIFIFQIIKRTLKIKKHL